ERLGQGQRLPGAAGVVAQELGGVGDAGDGHAVLGFGVVDAVAAGEVAAGLAGHVEAAAQDLGGQVQGQYVTGPGEQVDRDDGGGAHRVHVGEGVGGGDATPVVGAVDHRCEEVGRGHHRRTARQAHHRGVVTAVEPDEQLAGTLWRRSA